MSDLADRLEETLDVLDAVWSDGPTEYRGRWVDIARSEIHPKPVQRPRPPVLLAAYTPAGLDRVARRADGWNPTGLPVEALLPMWTAVRDGAATHGRDPDRLSLVVRANLQLTEQPIDGDRPSYHGSLDQIVQDLDDTRTAGTHEVILGPGGDLGLDELLDQCARLAESLDVTTAA
jgi:alkanesulfonate monooxygenase SsuD/methylene tetrahydromethanopterin reductase-like flavin-dependent oxidoreductase (luciferase family)